MTLLRKSPRSCEILRDPRLALMLALGFSSGLPFLLIFSTQSAWLREAGVSRSAIGLMSYAALAFTFKFAWAPIIDEYDPPLVGAWLGRRGWMLTAQLGVAAGLSGLAFRAPETVAPPFSAEGQDHSEASDYANMATQGSNA
jgi:MFS transporter, PAT family, beta-lactamase induction signal transducer AmpG